MQHSLGNNGDEVGSGHERVALLEEDRTTRHKVQSLLEVDLARNKVNEMDKA